MDAKMREPEFTFTVKEVLSYSKDERCLRL